jgi:hypothetical protein
MMGDPRCNCPPKTEISGVHAKDCPANAPLEEAGEPAVAPPATEVDLDGIRKRLDFVKRYHADSWDRSQWLEILITKDIPALLSLVERLQQECDELLPVVEAAVDWWNARTSETARVLDDAVSVYRGKSSWILIGEPFRESCPTRPDGECINEAPCIHDNKTEDSGV